MNRRLVGAEIHVWLEAADEGDDGQLVSTVTWPEVGIGQPAAAAAAAAADDDDDDLHYDADGDEGSEFLR